MLLLDGKKVRSEIAERLRERIAKFSSSPVLAIIQAGGREESNAYIARKKAFGESIGAKVLHIRLPESVSEDELIERIKALNIDANVHGIILQLPLPEGYSKQRIIDRILPEKDVDGLTFAQSARRAKGEKEAMTPATARGIVLLLEFYNISISGKKVAVLGRSALVGAPTAEALSSAGAKVTVCHSKTVNTKEITRASDVIVVAIGKPKLIGREYFREDKTQTVIDVGITAVRGSGITRLQEEIPSRQLAGDVDFEAVKDMVAAISPVPGGVGPMTVAALFENVVEAFEKQM
ncbi:MAG: C-1-tetrahydrofolate synthase [Parcubacteria group bacterium GW2011_GWA2_47_64]|nr:MAG: C-1-tetrahydrofolate synthase [Parcubacteria group bacterium GW2011_GWA2_47_64]KKU95933.1 MAG: C-1-tetrahydrofolate synthase [Parcubacteria group bacterium GW2011_GWC2_48_17]